MKAKYYYFSHIKQRIKNETKLHQYFKDFLEYMVKRKRYAHKIYPI